jgi:two-component system, NarL family, nitrate/nitrite response regulator NarL
MYREAISHILARHPRIRVTGATAETESVGHLLAHGRTDIVLVDMAMTDSVEVIRELAAGEPSVKVIALGLTEREADVIACAEAGISGYVTHDASVDDLAATIESVAQGEMPCSPGVAATLLRRVNTLAAQGDVRRADAVLTRRELQILGLIDEGLSNKAIAERLVIEVATVKNHVHNILEKLNVQRRGEAAALARTSGLATTARTRSI